MQPPPALAARVARRVLPVPVRRALAGALRGAPGRDAVFSALDAYVGAAPSAQTALDIFDGEWASCLPPPLGQARAGRIGLFDDRRIHWLVDQLGGVAGRRVLELGPLEAGHTYMLDRAGVKSTLA